MSPRQSVPSEQKDLSIADRYKQTLAISCWLCNIVVSTAGSVQIARSGLWHCVVFKMDTNILNQGEAIVLKTYFAFVLHLYQTQASQFPVYCTTEFNLCKIIGSKEHLSHLSMIFLSVQCLIKFSY
jgi:hypothetical protein